MDGHLHQHQNNPIAILALARLAPASPCASNMARLLHALPEIPREADKTRDAIRLLVAAEEAGGGDALGEARRLLMTPCAQSAANALIAIGHVATNCDGAALGGVKASERAVRDVVVLRCCALGGGVLDVDQGAFLEAAEVAFNKPLRGDFMMGKEDRDLRAVLLLAYRKLRRY